MVARPHGGVRGAGDAFIQARVKSNGHEARFDDVAGHGFMIVSRNGDPTAALSASDREFWQSLSGRTVRLGSAQGELFDAEGQYNRLMDDYGCDVIVKRPDYYIFGACPTARELPALIGDLRGQLQGRN